MDLGFRHDLWWSRLPSSPKDVGALRGIVLRTPGGGTGARELVDAVRVTVEGGLEGDRWSTDEHRTEADQVALINVHVLAAVAGDEPARRALSGDNLHVDLDLSEANLPVGTRLAIGDALLEVSPQPHQPCRKFHERFGVTAVKRVLRANRKGRRGRGVLCLVRRPGTLRVGDEVRVERPAS